MNFANDIGNFRGDVEFAFRGRLPGNSALSNASASLHNYLAAWTNHNLSREGSSEY
jgi:hypothetical protein